METNRKYHNMGEIYVDLQKMVQAIQLSSPTATASEMDTLTGQVLLHLSEARNLTARIYADAMLIERETGYNVPQEKEKEKEKE